FIFGGGGGGGLAVPPSLGFRLNIDCPFRDCRHKTTVDYPRFPQFRRASCWIGEPSQRVLTFRASMAFRRTCSFLIISISLILFMAQSPRRPILTINQIMEGPDFAGTEPSEVRWSFDSQKVFFRWKTPIEKKEGLYVVDRNSGSPRRLSDGEEKEAPPFGGID